MNTTAATHNHVSGLALRRTFTIRWPGVTLICQALAGTSRCTKQAVFTAGQTEVPAAKAHLCYDHGMSLATITLA